MHSEVLSNLIITKIYSATTMYTAKNTKIKRSNRSCWAIVIKYEGETIYFSKGKTLTSDKNNLFILPKGCSYEGCCTHSGHYSIIEFECENICTDIFGFYVKDSEKIIKLFKGLEYKRALKKPVYEFECIRYIYSILLMLTHTMQKKYTPTKKAKKFVLP